MKKTVMMSLIALMALSGCVSRTQADKKLENGCAAGAEIFLPQDHKIKKIKQSTFADSEELGKGYRVVRLQVVESNGWANIDKEIQCIFSEGFGPAGITYNATIYQLKLDGKTWGKEGDEILGSYDDQLRLTETVEQGMNRP